MSVCPKTHSYVERKRICGLKFATPNIVNVHIKIFFDGFEKGLIVTVKFRDGPY